MKKVYEKPGLYMESFSLSQSIATACGAAHDSTLGKPSYASKSSCGWDMGNFILWMEKPACNKITPHENFGKVCYNNPGGGNTIFSYS